MTILFKVLKSISLLLILIQNTLAAPINSQVDKEDIEPFAFSAQSRPFQQPDSSSFSTSSTSAVLSINSLPGKSSNSGKRKSSSSVPKNPLNAPESPAFKQTASSPSHAAASVASSSAHPSAHPQTMEESEDEDARKSRSQLVRETLKEAARKMGDPDKKWKVSEATKFLETTGKFNDFLTGDSSYVSRNMIATLQNANMWEPSLKIRRHQDPVVIDLDATTHLEHSSINIVSYLRAHTEHRGGPKLYTAAKATEVLKNSGRFKSLFESKNSRSLIHSALQRAKPSLFEYTNEAESASASKSLRQPNTHSSHATSSTSSSASATAVLSTHGQIMHTREKANSSLLPVQHGLPGAYYGSSFQVSPMHTTVGAHMSMLPLYDAAKSDAPRIQPIPAESLPEERVHPHTESSSPSSVTTLGLIDQSSAPKDEISAPLGTLSTDVEKYFLRDLCDNEKD